ncbi:MAG TPA: hypothetical protein VHE55_14785 [Fimbriimonadaceae bacterium]|nr:hypothetical protein [Fimbriimonadaceae bacterium]
MQDGPQIRGDYFTDRLGGWFEALLAAVSLGIVISRIRFGIKSSDEVLGALYFLEIIGAVAITRSKERLMRFAFWIFAFRVLAGLGYMSVVHGDKLARSTLGFPVVVAVYCWVRIRALRTKP